jgi:hypothetical protein
MATDDGINTLVLEEFRLHAADTSGEAARIVAAFPGGLEPAVPLLTSIDDQRDVAIVSALHVGETPEGDPRRRAALDPLVASWQPPRHYVPRITERSQSPPSHYRLAVTESGINNGESSPHAAHHPRPAEEASATRLDLLWIGLPVGTFAGLLTVVGTESDRGGGPERADWRLPFSRYLGVRIYESPR